jgi:predicted PurR-regulated permease PerM
MLKIEVSVRGVILIALGLLAIWAITQLWAVIVLILISLIFMVGLLPYVEGLVRLGLPRPAAVGVLLIGTLVVIAGLFSVMVPALVDEIQEVRDNLPESAREVEELADMFGFEVELQERARDIDWGGLISGRAAVDYGQRIVTVTISIITVIAMTAYLLSDTPRLGRFIGQFIPGDRKTEANEIFNRLTRVVGGYLRGQLITSLAIAIFTFVLLRIIGVPNALAFAVLAGFADVVPLVGAVIATIPPAAAALQESSTKALAVLVGMIAYQQFEDRILVPRVYGRTLNLPAIIVLIAVLAGAELLGIIGVLLALPLTAAARVAVDYLIESRQIVLPSTSEEFAATETSDQSSEQAFAPDMPAPDVSAPDGAADRREEERQDTPRRRQQSPPEASPGA